jgi:uncharacterized protein
MSDGLKVVQQFYALLAAGNVPAALGLLDPDVEWTEAERTPYYAGTLHGVEAIVAKVLQPIGEDFDNFAATPADFIAQGDRVAAFGTYSGVAKITGLSLEVPFVHAWTVANGRLQRFVQYTDSAGWNHALAKR